MRKFLLSTAAAVVLASGSAMAADLPARVAAVAPAPVFVSMSWAGFYVGGQIGAIQGRDKASLIVPVIPGANQAYTDTAIIGGLYAGYNWQFNSLVVGLEADANINGLGKTVNNLGVIAFPAGVTVRGTSQFEGALVAKVGVAFDRALLYVLGGVTVADFNTRYAGPALVSVDDTRFGWTIGAGAAYKFNPNWSARVEYRYSDFGKRTDIPGAAAGFFANATIRHSYTSQRVMVGLTYHFGGPAGAVVAKY